MFSYSAACSTQHLPCGRSLPTAQSKHESRDFSIRLCHPQIASMGKGCRGNQSPPSHDPANACPWAFVLAPTPVCPTGPRIPNYCISSDRDSHNQSHHLVTSDQSPVSPACLVFYRVAHSAKLKIRIWRVNTREHHVSLKNSLVFIFLCLHGEAVHTHPSTQCPEPVLISVATQSKSQWQHLLEQMPTIHDANKRRTETWRNLVQAHLHNAKLEMAGKKKNMRRVCLITSQNCPSPPTSSKYMQTL